MQKYSKIKFLIYFLIATFIFAQVFAPTLSILAADETEKATIITNNEAVEGIISENDEDSMFGLMKNISKDTNNLNLALVINNKKISLNAYDRSELSKYSKIYAALKNDPDAMKEFESTGNVPDKIKKDLEITIDPANYDIRVIQSLIYLVTPKDMGGAGREFLRVDSIVKGYTTEKKAQSNKETDPQQEVEDPETYLSSHYSDYGQAVDITQIDYLRGSQLVYVDGQLQQKTKLDKIPVSVSWQTDQQTSVGGSGPSIMGINMSNLFSTVVQSLITQNMQTVLDENGVDIDLTQNFSAGKTSGQILTNLATSWLGNNFDFPTGFNNFGQNLSSTGTNLGQNILSDALYNFFPAEGFSGNNLQELETNLGREYIAQQMQLPAQSLYGSTADDIFANIGKRKLEQDLDLKTWTLDSINFDKTSKDEIIKKIGQGYAEQILNLDQGSLSTSDVTKIKNNLGLKYNDIVENTKATDAILGVASGTTEKFKNNQFDDFYTITGNQVIDQTINYYAASESAFNSNVKDLLNQPSINYIKKVGKDSVAKALTTGTDTYDYAYKWLDTGKMPTVKKTEKNIEGKEITVEAPTIDTTMLESKYKMATGDLSRIFINDDNKNLRADEVFYRVGQVNLPLALSYNSYKDYKDTDINSIPSDDFYNTRFDEIKKQYNNLKNSSLKNSGKQYLDSIAAALDKSKQYNDQNSQNKATAQDENNTAVNLIPALETKQENSLIQANTIQIALVALEKLDGNNQNLQTIKKQVNEILSGKTIENLADKKTTDIYGLDYSPYCSDFFKKSLINIFQDKISANKASQQIGLAELSDIFDLEDENDLINLQSEIANRNSADWTQITVNSLGENQLKNSVNQINNALNSFGYATTDYNVDYENLANLFLGKTISTQFKIGGKVSNSAYNFMPGYGLKEFIEGTKNFNQIESSGGLTRIFDFLGLDREPQEVSTNSDIVSTAYSEEFLGLSKGSLKVDPNVEATVNVSDIIAKNGGGSDGMSRVLSAFGIQIPQEIMIKRDLSSSDYSTDLDNFFKKLQDPNNDYWKNPDNQAKIISTVANVGWDQDTVKNIITGKAEYKDYADLTKVVIDAKLGNDKEGLDDYLALGDTLFDGSYKIDGGKKIDLARALGNLEQITNMDLDSKVGFPQGTFASILSQPKEANTILLTQGMRTLSKMFVTDPSVNFTSVVKDGKVMQLGVDYTISNPVDWNSIGNEKWNLFGIAYKLGLTKDIPIKLTVNTSGSQDTTGDFSTQMEKAISQFTKIPEKFNQDLDKFLKGDVKNSLTAWGAANATDQYQQWYNKFVSSLPSGSSAFAPLTLVYDEARKAFMDLVPNSDDFNAMVKSVLNEQTTSDLAGNTNPDFNFEDYFDKKFATFNNNFKGEKLENLQYAVMDSSISQGLGINAPGPGFSKTMMKGTTDEKDALMKNYLLRVGLGQAGELGTTVANDSQIMGCLKDSKTCENINWTQNSTVTSLVDSQLRTLTGWDLPTGFTQTLLSSQNMTEWLKKEKTQYMIGNWLDKSTGMPLGTSFQVWNQYQQYQEALKTLQSAQQAVAQGQAAAQQLTYAQNLVNQRAAVGVNLILNMFLGKTFSQLDSNLGLPPGTTSLLVGTLVNMVMTGAAFGNALLAAAGGPIGLIIFAAFALFSMFNKKKNEVTVKILYTAGGYYPGFEDERDAVNKAYDKAKVDPTADNQIALAQLESQYDVIPTAEVEPGCPGEFNGENQQTFMQGAKPAAQYKIKVLLGNLLFMDEKTGKEELLPNQIQTFNVDDVKYYNTTRDIKYGYLDENGQVVSGSADKNMESGSKRGFGYNSTLFDRIYYSY